MEEAKHHGDEARLHQLQNEERTRNAAEQHLREEKQRAWQQHQEDVLRQSALQRQSNGEYQRGLAEREAHRRDLEQAFHREREQAAQERSQAALNERLREENERLRTLREERRQTVDSSGQTVIQEDNRTIYQVNNQYFIQHNDVERFRAYGGDYHADRLPDGNTISIFARPGGIRIEVETDTYGRPLRRVRISPDGERYVLFENRHIEAGVGFSFGSFVVDLAPPEFDMPREQYIVDADQASEDDMYNALEAPPVEPLERTYTLDEVCASVHLRERMRSVNIDTIHFESGSWEIGPDQASRLESVAAIMRNIVSQNPREMLLIEGHTDAVGSAVDNLSLSDRRAEAIANVLSQQFGVPAENLVTRGYGKQFLLVDTDGPEWRNRRVVIRRITPLLSTGNLGASGSLYDSGDRYRR
jgi:outer membrane protein OmpA-like peptidoglycan-associated protein